MSHYFGNPAGFFPGNPEDPEDGNYSSLTVEDIAAKFMASAMGTEAMTMGSRIDMDEILDLVEI